MSAQRQLSRNARKGFTLVEILIVVIILGILAAIVIPQFTNASEDARKSSLTSQLQTLRSQTELYKLQHLDKFPTDTGDLGSSAVWSWSALTTQTDETGSAYDSSSSTSGPFGPYLQAAARHSLNGKTGMHVSTSPDLAGGDVSGATVADDGWVITSTGKIYATTKDGSKIYNEATNN